MIYDTIIVGAGAAGLTAAIYTSRRALKTLVISQDVGGQAGMATEVENYPGIDSINGFELMQKFKAQAEKFGAEFVSDEVLKIEKKDDSFLIKTSSQLYESQSVILAFGLTHRHLGVKGEEEFIGRGVSYCATCDGPLYKGREVAVVGGGNSAVDAALFLSKLCPRVYLIHYRDRLAALPALVEKVGEQNNIELILNSALTEIKGDQAAHSIVIHDVNDQNKEREIKIGGLMVEIGYEVKPDLVKGLVSLDQKNQVVVTQNNETSVPGVFSAGDVTNIPHKQIVISAGEGAKAASTCYRYLQEKRGLKAGVDWGKKK